MAKRVMFVATDNKDARVGQRIYLDGWLAGVPEPIGWGGWPDGELGRWITYHEPIKVLLWLGRPFTADAALAELDDRQLIEEVYRWHLVNLEISREREEAYERRHPGRYRGIKWNVRYVTNFGRSMAFLRTFAARVHWINVYDPDRGKIGLNVEILTDEDARRFVRKWEVIRFISKYWWVFVFAIALAGLSFIQTPR
jgi:hypothetical protein